MSTQKAELTALEDRQVLDRVSMTRIVGGVAVAYAASVIVQNAMFDGGVAQLLGLGDGTGAPTYGAPLGEVLAYHAANRGAVAVAAGLEAFNMPLLLLFVTGLQGLVQRRGAAGADWSRLAVAAGATVSAIFAFVIATHIAVVLAADGLAEPTPAFELAWQLHAAAFALALPALGATFIGAALATHASGLTRPWQRLLGVAGGSCAHLGRRRKPRHRGWLATGVRRGCGLSRVARLARCHRPTADPWTGLTSLYATNTGEGGDAGLDHDDLDGDSPSSSGCCSCAAPRSSSQGTRRQAVCRNSSVGSGYRRFVVGVGSVLQQVTLICRIRPSASRIRVFGDHSVTPAAYGYRPVGADGGRGPGITAPPERCRRRRRLSSCASQGVDLADPEPKLTADPEAARTAALAAQVVEGLGAHLELRGELATS